MNINPVSVKQNFGLKLYDENGQEVKYFGTPCTYANSPAPRGNVETIINVKI